MLSPGDERSTERPVRAGWKTWTSTEGTKGEKERRVGPRVGDTVTQDPRNKEKRKNEARRGRI